MRKNFERTRKLHLYGVLEYGFFTLAADYVLLVLEGALRLRFISYYHGEVPVIRKGVKEPLPAPSFDHVRDAKRRGNRLCRVDGATHPLPMGAAALLAWARRERLLTGTRTQIIDRALAELRDHAAHPVAHTVLAPPDSARRITDIAEVINKLWGHDTPGGRLFPAPLARSPRVVALSPDRRAASTMRLDQARTATDRRDRLFGVFLAVEQEELVRHFSDGYHFAHRPGLQTTTFPCERLWQGSWPDLLRAIEDDLFASRIDTVQHLDRLFFVRAGGDTIDPARDPDDLLALAAPPEGRWYAITSDSPFDAWVHVRDHEDEADGEGTICSRCFVQIHGRFDTVAEAVALAQAAV